MASSRLEVSDCTVGPTDRPNPKFPWKLLLALVILKIALHLVASHGGWFRDELYYVACARRLSWSYVDHPSFSVLLLRGLLWASASLEALRWFAATCGALTLAGVVLLGRQLGADPRTALVAGLAVFSSPIFAGVHGFYSMNALEPIFWIAIALLAIGALQASNVRAACIAWAAAGLVGTVGFHNKVSMLWMIAPLVALASLVSSGKSSIRLTPLLALALVAVGSLPWLYWQMTHGFPAAEFVRNATQLKMQHSSPLTFIPQQLISAGPLTCLLSAYGAFAGLRGQLGSPAFVLGGVVAANAILLTASPAARSYYLVPAHTLGIALGAAALSRTVFLTKHRVLSASLASLLFVLQLAGIPLAVPLLPASATARYVTLLPVGVPREERSAPAVLPQHLADRYGWNELADLVQVTWASLPSDIRARTVVVTANYGQAAALELFLNATTRPTIASVHNQYWYWARPQEWDEAFLLIGFPEKDARGQFSEVRRLATFRCDWCREDGAPILLARFPRLPAASLWAQMKRFI